MQSGWSRFTLYFTQVGDVERIVLFEEWVDCCEARVMIDRRTGSRATQGPMVRDSISPLLVHGEVCSLSVESERRYGDTDATQSKTPAM